MPCLVFSCVIYLILCQVCARGWQLADLPLSAAMPSHLLSTFYSFFDSFRGPRACLVCLLAKVAQIGHQRCMWCQPILRAPTFAWHAPRVGPVHAKPAPRGGPTFPPESRGGHKKKFGKALFSRAPPSQLSLPGLIPAGGAEFFLAPNPALQK